MTSCGLHRTPDELNARAVVHPARREKRATERRALESATEFAMPEDKNERSFGMRADEAAVL